MKKDFHLKFHTKHILEIFKTLHFIFEEKNYADKAIEKTMRANKKWGVKDRAFVSDTVYDIVRNWRLLLTVAGIENISSENNCWDLFGTWLLMRNFELPESGRFNSIHPEKVALKAKKYERIRAIRESFPDWLDKLCEKEVGAKWNNLARALNKKPSMFLRVNLLKTTLNDLQKLLAEEQVETFPVTWAPFALELKFSRNVFRTEAFRQGLFEVQDVASQMVADFLDVKPGMRVIDGCAGTGGKTIHLSSFMKNKGRIIALDTKDWKLAELKKRASRAGANIIETKMVESSKTTKRLNATADRVLLDVPCSGLGVLRRNPDSKWKISLEEIERVKKEQREILERYSHMTKIGGKLVYAVCSILPSEGEEQIKNFISKNPSWEFMGEKRYSPELMNCDGFYMALLERKK
ncbi:MAG TPA: RsmB/NOP family class I SAM-dependent RNA methyltransferase [Bacteroidia bacterium]|nr:RsmB/NOP family class I SAM-dependent RNA methyltransferase [Bacteroidia bacterium]